MGQFTIPDLVLSDKTMNTTVPEKAVDAAFKEVVNYFEKMVPKLRDLWKSRLTPATKNRAWLSTHLGNVADKANQFGPLIIGFAKEVIQPGKNLRAERFKLPREAAATSNTSPDVMVDKTFDALTPWFEKLLCSIQPSYVEYAQQSANNILGLRGQLQSLEDRVNRLRDQFEDYINQQFASKTKSKPQSFSALAADEQEADLTPEAAYRVVTEVLGVQYEESEPVSVVKTWFKYMVMNRGWIP
ncbi:hypothetical protein QBC38DRAFT_549670 [Podospora fimiseda]|uniref:Uncharacterized protein n=1 Tax=Podospora fimiseda TaxID=252190 RepID=A0AAN7BF85_9PEZI|nr:hypothetical protein QBC38DRAFT_549670 [Podospora fimiseda]